MGLWLGLYIEMARQKVGIIGGAGAMGSFMAEVFSNAGYHISLFDVNEEAVKKLAKENGYSVEDGDALAKTL